MLLFFLLSGVTPDLCAGMLSGVPSFRKAGSVVPGLVCGCCKPGYAAVSGDRFLLAVLLQELPVDLLLHMVIPR